MLRQGWAPGQHRLPDMLGMGHTPAVHSGRTRLLEQSQLRGVVRLRCLHAHGASMRRQDPVPQPWLLYWSSVGLQGSMGCPSDMTLDQHKIFNTPCPFLCHAYSSHQGNKASQQVIRMQQHALTRSCTVLQCPTVPWQMAC